MGEEIKENFLRAYSKVPESLRCEEIIVLVEGKTYTWDSAYFEVKNDTELSRKILNTLRDTDII